MIDYLTCTIEVDFPTPLFGGEVISLRADGEIEYHLLKHVSMQGSHASSVQVRCIDCQNLEIRGNLAKFLQGHNLYGGNNVRVLLEDFLRVLFATHLQAFNPPTKSAVDMAKISRVDITEMFQLDTSADCALWLKTAAQSATIAYRGRSTSSADGNTLTWGYRKGKRVSRWALVIYNKGPEVRAHPLPPAMMQDTEVLEWVCRCVRVELRITGEELKRLGKRRLQNWDRPGTAEALWKEHVGRVRLMDSPVKVDDVIGVKPRVRDAFSAWSLGVDPAAGRSLATYKRLRSEVRTAYGVDIAVPVPPPGSAVLTPLPLKRILSLRLVGRPDWAERVEQLLAA